MKITLRLTLAAFGLAVFIVSPATVQAQFKYVTNNGTITITRYAGTNAVVTIPPTINGLPVTTIANGAFRSSSMTSVTIPDSITGIGGLAFSNCTSLLAFTVDVRSQSRRNHAESPKRACYYF